MERPNGILIPGLHASQVLYVLHTHKTAFMSLKREVNWQVKNTKLTSCHFLPKDIIFLSHPKRYHKYSMSPNDSLQINR